MVVSTQMGEKGYSPCEDIVKIFVTSHPTFFDLSELRKWREPIKTRNVDRTSRKSGGALEIWVFNIIQ